MKTAVARATSGKAKSHSSNQAEPWRQALAKHNRLVDSIDSHALMRYKIINCDTRRCISVPVSLRVSPEKEEMIRKAAARSRKSKTAYILEAIDEKLGTVQNREQTIRELAGWMSHEEAEELRSSLRVFDKIHEGDWD